MKNPLNIYLLNRFQHVSDWLQDWFGITNFVIARRLMAIALIMETLKVICRLVSGGIFPAIVGLFIMMIILAVLWIHFRVGEEICKKYPQYQNPMSIILLPYRSFLLALLIIAFILLPLYVDYIIHAHSHEEQYYYLGSLFSEITDITLFLFLYFASCTPKPPQKSKIKKMKEKAIEAIESMKERINSPEPVLSTIRLFKLFEQHPRFVSDVVFISLDYL